jgi:hypothetical protein
MEFFFIFVFLFPDLQTDPGRAAAANRIFSARRDFAREQKEFYRR